MHRCVLCWCARCLYCNREQRPLKRRHCSVIFSFLVSFTYLGIESTKCRCASKERTRDDASVTY